MTVREYNKCVEDYSDNVYRFLLKNLKEEERARDIVQESFEKMWVRAGEIEYGKAKSYLFSTAYHTMIDMIRKEKRLKVVESYEGIERSHEDNYTDLNEVLHKALNQLPDIQRSVVLLRDYEGYSYKEISEIVDISESQVKVYIYRGRMALKKYLVDIESVL